MGSVLLICFTRSRSFAPAGAALAGRACNPRLAPWAMDLPPLPGLPCAAAPVNHRWLIADSCLLTADG